MTTRLPKGVEMDLLKAIYRKYVDENGVGIRRIGSFKILITAQDTYSQAVPRLKKSSGQLRSSYFVSAMLELQALGYVEYDGKSAYQLTERGFQAASKSTLQRVVDYFNENQGLAIPISIVSLIVAVIALFVAA